MRISDWSSDVCSSDLKRERSPHRLVSRSPQSDVGGRCRLDLRDKRFSSRQSCVEVLEHVPPCVHRHRRQQQLRERGKRALQGFDFLGQQAERPQLGQVLALRSEEHTSELQSLMRISYAVFCLKKKKSKKVYREKKHRNT